MGSHFGGVEIYIEGLADILQGNAELFALCSLPKLADSLRSKGASVVCVPILYNKWCKALRLLIAIPVVPFLVVRHRIDIAQLNGYFESTLLPLLRVLGCRTVYTMHGPFESELYRWYRNPERFFPRLISKLCLRMSSRIVCVSETVGKIGRRALGAEKVSVIPNWVAKLPVNVHQGAGLNTPARLLFAGRLEQYKGVQLVLEAIRDLPAVSFVIVGDGSYRGELERLAAGMNVQFEGFQSDTARYYSTADIFVNPSMGPEGLPLVSLEAMAYGLPCLFSDLPVHREITDDGGAGTLYRTGDAGDLKVRLIDLLEDPAGRQAKALAALQLINERYSRQAAQRKYLELFELPVR